MKSDEEKAIDLWLETLAEHGETAHKFYEYAVISSNGSKSEFKPCTNNWLIGAWGIVARRIGG